MDTLACGKVQIMNVLFISLGCDKNLSDSEHMLRIICSHGYQITDDETAADVIVINTCCFINDAKEESIQTIIDMGKYRTEGNCRALIVTGCLAQRYKDEIRREIPEVDAVVGTASFDHVLEAIESVLKQQRPDYMEDLSRLVPVRPERILTTGGHYAYLKIAEGCCKNCTYCVIPSVRGPYRSMPMDHLLEEARQLAEDGVKELILVAQETTLYGTDLYGKRMLHELIHELCSIDGLYWIRLLYCYPEEIYPELIDCMAKEEKFCHYLDLPIQHADDEILRRMGRRTCRKDLERIIHTLRERIPDIVLRTTLITGFPGETEEQHERLMDFIDEMEFDHLGVFPYSCEEGTPAGRMSGQISEEVKKLRQSQLMELQQEISMDLLEKRVGTCMDVFVEGKAVDEDVYVCRTYADAPGIDGYLFLHTDQMLVSGDFAKVKVTAAGEYDLIGELLPDLSQ